MSPNEFMDKASRAVASAKLLLDAGDVEGACNRAYYAMFIGEVQREFAPPKPKTDDDSEKK